MGAMVPIYWCKLGVSKFVQVCQSLLEVLLKVVVLDLSNCNYFGLVQM